MNVKYTMYHPLGIPVEFSTESDDVFATIAEQIKYGYLAMMPDEDTIAKNAKIAESYGVIEVSHVIRATWIISKGPNAGKEAHAAFIYAPWGQETYGSQMTVYMNNPQDIADFNAATGLNWDSLDVLEDNAGPKRSHRDFREFAVEVKNCTLTRVKKFIEGEYNPDGSQKYTWEFIKWGGVAKEKTERSSGTLDATAFFSYCKDVGVDNTVALAALGVKNLGDFKGTWEEAIALVNPAGQKPATPKSKGVDFDELSKKSKKGLDLEALETQVYQSWRLTLDDVQSEENENVFMGDLKKFKTTEDAFREVSKWCLENDCPMYTSKIRHVKEGVKKRIEFVGAYAIQWYGKREDLAEQLGIPEIATLEGELVLEENAVEVKWQHKGNYLLATELSLTPISDF